MRVLFDLAELGPYARTGRGGIRRVIESAAIGLLAREELDVRFTGLTYGEACSSAPDFATGVSPTRFFSRGSAVLDVFGRGATTLARKMSGSAKPGFDIPARLLWRGAEFAEKRATDVKGDALRWAQIYHSPFRAIPPRVNRTRNLTCFLLIHDLIPITHPTLSAEHFQDALREVVASITPSTWITCTSQHVKEELCSRLRVPEWRVFVTPLAASSELFRPCAESEGLDIRCRYGIAENPYILSVGANDVRKNISHLAECFGRITARGQSDDLRLVLVGNATQRVPLEALKLKYPDIAERVIFTGFVPADHLAALYSGAVAFAFPSLAEGFGLPVLEAMQCGAPVISSNATSLPEVVGDAGVLLPPNDIDAWCDALVGVACNSDLRAELKARSLARAELFSWDRTVEALVAAYSRALGDKTV